jgi:hypothetical protein
MAATMPSPTPPPSSKLRLGGGVGSAEELLLFAPTKTERRFAKDEDEAVVSLATELRCRVAAAAAAFCSAAGSCDHIILSLGLLLV